MKYSYIIIDDNQESILNTQAVCSRFQSLYFVASAMNYDAGLNLILECQPQIIFLEVDPEDKSTNLSFQLINELYRYLKEIPKIIITTKNTDHTFEAIKQEVFDYLIKPIGINELRKTVFKLDKSLNSLPSLIIENKPTNKGSVLLPPVLPETEATIPTIEKEVRSEMDSAESDLGPPVLEVSEATIPTLEIEGEPGIESAESDLSSSSLDTAIPEDSFVKTKIQQDKPLVICVKSYGDYRFIDAKDICYLKADNNSTDIHLYNGEMITAFKTLKHFEGVLSAPFVRIHNSYIVNIDYVSRIHTGNSVCYIKNTITKLPFSKSYKENVDSIINSITNGNYLEI